MIHASLHMPARLFAVGDLHATVPVYLASSSACYRHMHAIYIIITAQTDSNHSQYNRNFSNFSLLSPWAFAARSAGNILH